MYGYLSDMHMYLCTFVYVQYIQYAHEYLCTLSIRMYTYICMYVCPRFAELLGECTYINTYVRKLICKCTHVRTYICIYVCMYVNILYCMHSIQLFCVLIIIIIVSRGFVYTSNPKLTSGRRFMTAL